MLAFAHQERAALHICMERSWDKCSPADEFWKDYSPIWKKESNASAYEVSQSSEA